MNQLIEGIYHDGHIDVTKPIPLQNDTKLKLWIITEKKNSRKLGSYRLGKAFDKVNIRDYAHED